MVQIAVNLSVMCTPRLVSIACISIFMGKKDHAYIQDKRVRQTNYILHELGATF